MIRMVNLILCAFYLLKKKMEEKRKWTKFRFLAVKQNKDVLYIHEGLISKTVVK